MRNEDYEAGRSLGYAELAGHIQICLGLIGATFPEDLSDEDLRLKSQLVTLKYEVDRIIRHRRLEQLRRKTRDSRK